MKEMNKILLTLSLFMIGFSVNAEIITREFHLATYYNELVYKRRYDDCNGYNVNVYNYSDDRLYHIAKRKMYDAADAFLRNYRKEDVISYTHNRDPYSFHQHITIVVDNGVCRSMR